MDELSRDGKENTNDISFGSVDPIVWDKKLKCMLERGD